jgi:DtxR family Mn-dependent transcriptional regulator
MIRKLHDQGLVEHVPYRGVTLAPAGRQEALRLVRFHRLWELFLAEVMDLSWDEVHEEAHRLEYATSDRLADRLAEYLDQPQVDPHGHRIPSREGALPPRTCLPLAEIEAGQTVALLEVPDGDPELLRYLGDQELYPGTVFQVMAVAPFNGPLTVRVGERDHTLGRELAGRLMVTYALDNKEEHSA